MQSNPRPFGIRGFLLDAPEYGFLRSRRNSAIDLAALLPYGKQGRSFDDITPEGILALCIYRGGLHANLESYTRGKCVYRAPEPAVRA